MSLLIVFLEMWINLNFGPAGKIVGRCHIAKDLEIELSWWKQLAYLVVEITALFFCIKCNPRLRDLQFSWGSV